MLLIFLDTHSIENSTMVTCLLFYLITLFHFCKYMLILNLMSAPSFKHIGAGATKDWEMCGTLQKHLFGTSHRFTVLLVTGNSIMIGYEREIFERLSCLQERG